MSVTSGGFQLSNKISKLQPEKTLFKAFKIKDVIYCIAIYFCITIVIFISQGNK